MGFGVVRCVVEDDVPFDIEADAVARIGKVFGGEPPANGVVGKHLERDAGCIERGFCCKHLFFHVAKKLDMAEWQRRVVGAEIVVVDCHCLFIVGWVDLFGDGDHHAVLMEHVVPADEVASNFRV